MGISAADQADQGMPGHVSVSTQAGISHFELLRRPNLGRDELLTTAINSMFTELMEETVRSALERGLSAEAATQTASGPGVVASEKVDIGVQNEVGIGAVSASTQTMQEGEKLGASAEDSPAGDVAPEVASRPTKFEQSSENVGATI